MLLGRPSHTSPRHHNVARPSGGNHWSNDLAPVIQNGGHLCRAGQAMEPGVGPLSTALHIEKLVTLVWTCHINRGAGSDRPGAGSCCSHRTTASSVTVWAIRAWR